MGVEALKNRAGNIIRLECEEGSTLEASPDATSEHF